MGATGGMWLELRMAYKFKAWHFGSLSQIHHPFAKPSAASGHFDHHYPDDRHAPSLDSQTGNGEWLEILRFFTAVENLYLSVSIARFFAPVLRELAAGESAATAWDVLPAPQTLFVERLDLSESGPVRETVGEFVAARKLSSHPVAVHHWVCNWPPLPWTSNCHFASFTPHLLLLLWHSLLTYQAQVSLLLLL